MSLQGEIQTMPLEDLLQWLELVQKTGTLTIERQQIQQQFYFRNGEIAAASSSRYHNTDSEKSARAILTDTLHWESGKFSFAENHIPDEYASVHYHLSPLQIVLETATQFDEMTEAARQSGPTPVKRFDIGRGSTTAENLRLAIIGMLLKSEFKVPLLPTAVTRILEITQKDDYSLRDLSEVILSDQVITAQLLKHSNSALYNRGNLIENVPMAVQRLGAQAVTNLVLTLSLQSVVTGRDFFTEERKRLWKHSLACALLSRAVAPLVRVEREQAFLCGLLIDFGKPVMYSLIQELMQEQPEYQTTPKDVIDYLVNTYHPKVGSVVGEKWKLPTAVQEAITSHHALVMDSPHIRHVGVSSVCDAILTELAAASSASNETNHATVDMLVRHRAAQLLELNAEQIEQILALVPDCLEYAQQMAGG